ncbi:hypothetical protein CHUAL_014096 [Chamberlinius hualienensis]
MAKQLNRLQEVQKEDLEKCLESINNWEKFREDYCHLKTRLLTIADRIDYDVMVPFGSVAFMPGKLRHTNEMLVLLGDSIFAERSAKQACEILQRRIESCDSHLRKLEQEKQQIENWKSYTKTIGDDQNQVNIVEEYNEEAEKEWRERRTKAKKTRAIEPVSGVSFEKLMNRLDELELEEEMERIKEMEAKLIANVEAESLVKETASVKPSWAKVRWKDEVEDNITSEVKTIQPNFTFNSPADIFNYHQLQCEPKPLKSILKSISQPNSNGTSTGTKPKIKIVERSHKASKSSKSPEKQTRHKSTSIAIRDVVTEHRPSSKPKVVPPDQYERVSLFKANQMLKQ